MAQAPRDSNYIPTLLGTSSVDGTTPIVLWANPTSHGVLVADAATGSDLSGDVGARDNNYVPVMMAISSVDGVTPTPVYIDPTTHELLIKST